MRNLFTALGLALVLATVSGCTLYFGDDDDDDRYYSYCDDTGCWTCDSYTGECWSDGGQYGCYADYDCAAGCYCDEATGACIEAGYCQVDGDCGDGYVCDDRASCVPDGSQSCWETGCGWGAYCDQWTGECVPSTTCTYDEDCGTGYACLNNTCTPVGCTSDDQCAAACYCDEPSGGCVESAYCKNDGECVAQLGEGYTCDEDRSTCVPTDEPPPPPSCAELTAEADCLGRDDCNPVYTGLNCTNPNDPSDACEPGDSGCVCEDFVFAACVDAGGGAAPTTLD